MTGDIPGQVYEAWRRRGRAAQPDSAAHVTLSNALGEYCRAHIRPSDPAEKVLPAGIAFLDALWDSLTTGAILPAVHARVLILSKNRATRELGIRLAAGLAGSS